MMLGASAAMAPRSDSACDPIGSMIPRSMTFRICGGPGGIVAQSSMTLSILRKSRSASTASGTKRAPAASTASLKTRAVVNRTSSPRALAIRATARSLSHPHFEPTSMVAQRIIRKI